MLLPSFKLVVMIILLNMTA